MSDYSDLISELSNPIRIKILFLLNENPATLTNVSETIGDISKSEVSRHLSRLLKHGFIQKEMPSGRNYEISPFGKVVILNFSPINFLFQHFAYFKTHRIDDLPENLIRKIDVLKDCEFINGVGEVMSKIQDFQKAPVEERWIMGAAAFPFKAISAKKVNYIFIPDILKYEGRTREEHPNSQFRVCTLENIAIALAFNSLGYGLLCFPKTNEDKPDYSEVIIIKDNEGIEFRKEMWDYFWSKGKIYS